MRKDIVAKAALIGALAAIGGSAPVLVPSLVAAVGPTATPNAVLAVSPTATASPTTDQDKGPGFGGPNETVSDASVVAKALGMTEADLNTAVSGGKTIAAVAKDKGVSIQVVIDALVADKKAEIAAELKAGSITRAQADSDTANATQFATDQVNGTGFGDGKGGHDGHGGFGPGGRGGANETVSDASVVAKAIGIAEGDLNTALTGGQTIAAVAKAHNVNVQVVIDALVADKKAEIADEVKAGTETQAQADAELANVVQFATDQVNGTGFGGGPGGHGGLGGGRGNGGHGGHGPDGAPGAAPSSGTNG